MFYRSDFIPNPSKKHKKNATGEDVFLRPDGTIERDEDKIVNLQRRWKHVMYAPGGAMYMKVRENFYARQKYYEDPVRDPCPCSPCAFSVPSPSEIRRTDAPESRVGTGSETSMA